MFVLLPSNAAGRRFAAGRPTRVSYRKLGSYLLATRASRSVCECVCVSVCSPTTTTSRVGPRHCPPGHEHGAGREPSDRPAPTSHSEG